MVQSVDDKFVAGLVASHGETLLRESSAGYLTEPRGRWKGQGVVVAPRTTQEVADIVRQCAAADVGIVPYAGGTGLVSGQIKGDGAVPLVVSLERMTAIRAVYPDENVLVCDAGCILAQVQEAAEAAGRMFPLSLASEGTARIGGLLGTNAGGVNVLRYGNARAQVLGLEVVTAQGQIWHGLTRLRKDNTGYDLRDLMIGSEGTLGIITAAALKLVPRPAIEAAALLVVPSPRAALDLLSLAQGQIGEGISAFELIHRQGWEFLAETGVPHAKPFGEIPEWSVLIDLGLGAGQSPQAALEHLFEVALDAGLVSDGVIAQSEAQRQAFWSIRESIPEGNKRIGSISSHDIGIPLSRIPEFIDVAPAELAKVADVRINCFGHLGDGNLHYNVFPAKGRDRKDYDHVKAAVQEVIHDLVVQFEGSISAEHGIGRHKVADLERYADPQKLVMMRAIKAALDPQGIMNPGAVLAV